MIIGHTHPLRVNRVDYDTVWLEHPAYKAIALPLNEAPQAQVGDTLQAFVFTDSQGEAVATLTPPKAQLGECANLKVSSITDAGAFLNWGIRKELLLPFAEQRRPLQVDAHECVMVYIDNSGRLAASSRLDHHLPETWPDFTAWQQVSILVYQRTDLGYKAVINHCCIGLLYKDEIFQPIKMGSTLTAYVKRLRHDGRIDLALQPTSQQLKDDLSSTIMDYLQQHDGICPLSDKSSPELIYSTFNVSKKNFKRAISSLYKQRLIIINNDSISLANNEKPNT